MKNHLMNWNLMYFAQKWITKITLCTPDKWFECFWSNYEFNTDASICRQSKYLIKVPSIVSIKTTHYSLFVRHLYIGNSGACFDQGIKVYLVIYFWAFN